MQNGGAFLLQGEHSKNSPPSPKSRSATVKLPFNFQRTSKGVGFKYDVTVHKEFRASFNLQLLISEFKLIVAIRKTLPLFLIRQLFSTHLL